MLQRRLSLLGGLTAKALRFLPILLIVLCGACYARAAPGYYGSPYYNSGRYYRSAPPARHYYYAPDYRRERGWHGRPYDHRSYDRHDRYDHGGRHHHH